MSTFNIAQKVSKMKLSKQVAKELTGQLNDLKLWTDLKSPRLIRPVLKYALDWLSPQMLGTGFTINESSETCLIGHIPLLKTNLNQDSEINAGLVLNASFEMARLYLSQIFESNGFKINFYDVKINKKNKWDAELKLILNTNETDMDEFFMQLDLSNKAQLDFEFEIYPEVICNKTDRIKIKSEVIKINLISGKTNDN